jgi:4-amino-4-deoxy-L-arabinose transferase-like glycosyltransferase
MTTLAPPSAEPRLGPAAVPARSRLRSLIRARAGEAAWVLPATAGVLVLATILYVVNLTVSGYANVYYSGAAWAASQSWSAWFFGSIDPSNFITVDKPPLATMVMGLSVRLFGLSSASILLPQALMGVGTVALTMATVRRTFGAPASIIAGLVTALTPAAVLIFRYNNPDALLTLLLVGSAYAFIRALEHNSLRWVALAGVLVGLGFETKLLQAYLVLPVFALVWAFAAPGSIRRRIAGLGVALASVTVASAWWVGAMELIPAASRAYVGGSTNNSALDLVLGYDGLGRIFGGGGGGGGNVGGQGGAGFSGTPGILRLFNSQLGGQVAWFLPLSVVGLAAGLIARHRAPRTDLARAAFLMWGGWLAIHAIVFSFMSGVIHSYYVVAMAPAVGALVGGGVVAMWRARDRHPWTGAILGLSLAASAGLALVLLDRTPTFVPGLGLVVLAVTAITVPLVALRPGISRGRVQVAGAALALAMLLAGPMAYAVDTMQTAYSGGDPSAGPTVSGSDIGPGGPGGGQQGAPGGAMGAPGEAMGAPGGAMGGPDGTTRADGAGGPDGGDGAGGAGRTQALDAATGAYLVANQGSSKWIVAVSDASTASTIELALGKPVMAIGGFSGSDNALTLDGLKALVASGDLRFIATASGPGGDGGGGGRQGSSEISTWVATACSALTIDGSSTSVYDCAGAVSG